MAAAAPRARASPVSDPSAWCPSTEVGQSSRCTFPSPQRARRWAASRASQAPATPHASGPGSRPPPPWPPSMQLRVRSLRGKEATVSVTPSTPVDQLKLKLHTDGAVDIPPEKQRLMHVGKSLAEGTLQEAGVCDGDSLVVLLSRPVPPPMVQCANRVPDREAIKAATTAEAEARGTQATASTTGRGDAAEDAAAPAGGGGAGRRGGSNWESHIHSLLSAVAGIGSVGPDDGSDGDEEVGGDMDEPVPSPEVAAEPLAQLLEMGFPEPRVRKALVLGRNNTALAMEWLLQHSEDASADTPLTRRQVRTMGLGLGRGGAGGSSSASVVPAAAARAAPAASAPQGDRGAALVGGGGAVEPDPQLLQQLVEMGFVREAAAAALRSARNDHEAACSILLSDGGGSVPAASAAGGEGAPSEEASGDPLPPAAAAAAAAASTEGDEAGGSSGDVLGGLIGRQGTPPGILQDILRHPSVRQGMQSQRVMEAFQAMVENPLAAHQYLSDPEVGPILLQVHNVLLRSADSGESERS